MTAKNKIVFVKLPAGFKMPEFHTHCENHNAGFKFNPEIPLPVELEDGEATVNFEKLSIERLLSGMLYVILEGEEAKNLFYYRNFVLAARPKIKNELGGAAISKARNGDFASAGEIIALLKALFPAAPDVLLLQALILEDETHLLESMGKESAARSSEALTEKAYREALSHEEPLCDAFFYAGMFYLTRENYALAREYLDFFIKNSADCEEKEKAENIVGTIDKTNLTDERFHKAYILIRDGKEEEGLKVLRPFLELNSYLWHGWFLAGWALRKLKRWKDAEGALKRAVELGAEKADVHNELAICLMEGGNLPEARRALFKALRSEPQNVKIISNLAVLSLKMGNVADAEGFFRTVLEISPDDELAHAYFKNSAA